MKKELQRNVNGMTSGGGSIQHPFSIHSASIGSRWKVGGLQSLMMTILLLFTMGIGQMWGDTAYGFENNKTSESGYPTSAGDGERAISSSIKRTGSYSLEQNNKNTSDKD